MSGTIAAIATPCGQGGLSVIRISGNDAIRIGDLVFRSISNRRLSHIKGYTALYGCVYSTENEKIDDAVALIFRAPRSYTGEDVVELTCHGGYYVTEKLLRTIFEAGAEPAMPGEFTKRAFLNGKLSLTEAEAVNEIIMANTEHSAKTALSMIEGNLAKKINSVKDELLKIAGHLSAWADYPDEDIEQLEPDLFIKKLNIILKSFENLIQNYDNYKLIRDGIDTVIVGKPNVGKSTLMNVLTGENISIITDIPGTTRDLIQEYVKTDNLILKLTDTAGIHETNDVIENIGIQKAINRLDKADLILAVFDGSVSFSDDDFNLIKNIGKKRCIAVINKTDIGCSGVSQIERYFEDIIYISAKEEKGISELRKKISEITGADKFDPQSAVLINERQRNAVLKSSKYLKEGIEELRNGQTLDAVSIIIDSSIKCLMELTGENVSEKVIDEIFSNFCVGK